MRMEARRTQRESTKQPSPITTQVIMPMSTMVKLGCCCNTTRGVGVEVVWSAIIAVITKLSSMRRSRHGTPVAGWLRPASHAWSGVRTGYLGFTWECH